MSRRVLVTTDLHLTDRPRDAYRWTFVEETLPALLREHEPEWLFVLGDLTDRKDNHPARLVNRIVDWLRSVRQFKMVLKGNHDYIDPGCPFFGFIEEFVSEPRVLDLVGPHVALFPHGSEIGLPSGNLGFCHHSFKGARLANGSRLDSGSAPPGRELVSGDVHVPQMLGNVEYAGSPYPIDFGDNWEPRVLLLDWVKDKWRRESIPVRSIRKLRLEIDSPEALRLLARAGDQIKAVMKLPRAEFGRWEEIKAAVALEAERGGFDLCGLELQEKKSRRRESLAETAGTNDGPPAGAAPEETLREFCRVRGLAEEIEKAGLEILHE